MSKKIYLAGPFFDDEQIERIEKVEQALYANPTLNEEDIYSPRKNQHEEYEFGTKEWRKTVFNADVAAIENADLIVSIVDFEGTSVDSGTAWELGYAYKLGLPLVILKDKKETKILNLMISDSLTYYTDSIDELSTYNFDEMPTNTYDGEIS